MKKFFLVGMFFVGMSIVFNSAYAYSDVPKDFWGYDCITKLSERKIVSGYPNGMFMPQKNMTTAEFLSILLKVTGQSVDVSSNTGYWAEEIIKVAEDKKILILKEYENFNPDAFITRGEICKMLCRCLEGVYNIELDELYNKKEFFDIDKNNSDEYMNVALLSHFDILNGYPDGSVKLENVSTRAEICLLFAKFLNKKTEILSLLNDKEIVSYEGNDAIINEQKLPDTLKKMPNAKDVPYVTTRINKIDLFAFNNPPDEYKKVFDEINTGESRYLKYRKKFGENNYVIAVYFTTINNMYNEETYAGYEFLHVIFPKEEVRIIDSFDTAEFVRQAAGNGNTGEFIKPCGALDTYAFYIVDKLPEQEILFRRSITGSYDFDSFHSLIVTLGGR